MGQFSTGYRATIGTDFITKSLPHLTNPDETVTLQIWVRSHTLGSCFCLTTFHQDTAGQERFSGLSSAFFRGADAVLLMFDVNRPETLQGLHKWWGEFKARAPVADEDAEDFCVVVVGNKIDLVESTQTNGAGPSRVTESDAERFLEELIPRSEVEADEEDSFEENDLFLSRGQEAGGDERRESLFSLPPSWSRFLLRTARQESSSSDTQTVSPDPAPQQSQTQSITIQNSEPERIGKRSGGKSRSSERSLFGGTVASGRSIYHTPSSSLFESDEFHSISSASQSPVNSPKTSSGIDSHPSTPIRSPRRMTSSSTTSSAPTITPSLFIRTRATSTASQTPPTPPEPGLSGDYLFTPPPRRSRKADLPPRPERRPHLFLTSAKTGAGITPIFDHIARRVQMQWAYEGAIESLRSSSRQETDIVRLETRSSTSLRERWSNGTSACCGG